MCGIIGYIGSKPVVPVLLDGLRRMEYRGYDSAGVALVSPEGIALRRSAGKLANLETRDSRGTRRWTVRRRPHAMGHAWPPHRGERAPPSRLHRPHRGRAQRDHRELPRTEAGAAGAGTPVQNRNRHRDRRPPRRARDARRRPRAGGPPRTESDARHVRDRARVGRRPGEDCRSPQRPADCRRPRR